MLSEDYIMKLLKAYTKTAAGKLQIEQYKEDVFNGKIKGGTGSSGLKSRAQMIEIGNKMKDILYDSIQSVIRSFDKNGIIVNPPIKDSEGNYFVQISFQPSALHRKSLDDDLYPDGLDNIVMLFAKGYEAKNYIYGWWDGHKPSGVDNYGSGGFDANTDYAWVRSRKQREANDYLISAVNIFNSQQTGDIVAELNSAYKNT